MVVEFVSGIIVVLLVWNDCAVCGMIVECFKRGILWLWCVCDSAYVWKDCGVSVWNICGVFLERCLVVVVVCVSGRVE